MTATEDTTERSKKASNQNSPRWYVTPHYIRGQVDGPVGRAGVECIREATVNVWHDHAGIAVDLDGRRDDNVTASAMAHLSPSTARRLAAYLLEAVEDHQDQTVDCDPEAPEHE